MPDLQLPEHLRLPRLNRTSASEYLRIVHGLKRAPATLAKLACLGGGPGYHLAGRQPIYDVLELDAWAVELLGPVRRSSSDKGGAE